MQFNIPAEHKHASGVYIIRNSINKKVYVGSAVNFWKRFYAHKWGLAANKHANKKLQYYCNKYGIDTLGFYLLELVERDLSKLAEAEQRSIVAFNAADIAHGFNIVRQVFPVALHSEETKQKMSASMKALGRKMSEEHKEILRKNNAARKGLPGHPISEVQKRAITLMQTGQKLSEETKQKISASRKGQIPSVQTREKISAARKKQPPFSEETRQKISAAHKGRKPSEETRQRMSASQRNRQKILAALKATALST